MKKAILLILGMGIATLLSAQTAQDELAEVAQAIGGAEAVQMWNDIEAEGNLIYSAYNREFSGDFRLVRNGSKNWIRIALNFGSETYVMINAYDGQVAWAERMGQVTDQPTLNEETKAKHGIGLLVKKDATWALGKESEVTGKKVISLEADWHGKKTVFWIDPATHLVQEISYKDLMIGDKEIKEYLDIRTRYEDYQKIGNVMFPMKTVNYLKGSKSGELRFVKVTFNPKITPTLFQRPQQKIDLRYYEEIID
jgi:hypothetical protein